MPPRLVLSSFIAEFSDLLHSLQLSGHQSIICGDLNCPGNDAEVPDNPLHDVLLSYNLKQHVHVSTNELGHVLDLIITRDDIIDLGISNITVSSQCISDHSLVACNIKTRHKNQAKHTTRYRTINNIDLDTFKSNIHPQVSPIWHIVVHVVGSWIHLCDRHWSSASSWQSRTDMICRKMSGSKRLSLDVGWGACSQAELLSTWMSLLSNTAADRVAQEATKQAVTYSRTAHLKIRLSDVASNPKQIWNVMKDLLHEYKKEINRHCNTNELADTYFFHTKLFHIRNTIALMLTAGLVMFGQHWPILNSFGRWSSPATSLCFEIRRSMSSSSACAKPHLEVIVMPLHQSWTYYHLIYELRKLFRLSKLE